MNWKSKALLQNLISFLPKTISYEIYFLLQRHLGGLKKPFSPLHHFEMARQFQIRIERWDRTWQGKTFFEVGTGRAPLVPIGLWLLGAGKTITYDLNPYMKQEILEDMCFFFRTEEDSIRAIFQNSLQEDRLQILLDCIRSQNTKIPDILKLCNITYHSPADASKTELEMGSVDFHISHAVYQHIPIPVLEKILEEGNRIVSQNGLFINNIDYRDLFSLMDPNLPSLNFLRFSDKEWDRYAGNRFMYMNRARHDDFLLLFGKLKQNILELETYTDPKAKELLENALLPLDPKFQGKSKEILAITNAWFVSKKSDFIPI